VSAAVLAAVAGLLLVAVPAASASLEVGVGRADITPPTGYYMMGWVRSDGLVTGQNTRLWARVIVLKDGDRKVALVAEDLNAIPGGMMAAAAQMDSDIGFSEQNVLDSASHTHAGPTGFYNFTTYNTVFMSLNSPSDFNLGGTIDPQLYAFEVRRLALAIRRANANLGPGRVGWGFGEITDLTENRSLEAHLADHGIQVSPGQGNITMDPDGPAHTLDPEVNVLRVDKLIGKGRKHRQIPVGMWSTFADHGTVNRFQFTYYNEDHHGAATQLTEATIRRSAKVPRGQDVVDVYGNTDEGDQSAALHRFGPAAAEGVGRAESDAFMQAWRQAGQSMQSSPALDWRWTRMCWCGQTTAAGPTADRGAFGLAEFTGSEEGRGPLFDLTHIPFEGQHLPLLPIQLDPQGDKEQAPLPVDVPKAVPLMALRVGSRLIVSIPGEMTAEMGRRVRSAVLGAAGRAGVERAVISGLANEYNSYFTTPQEYDTQHYEGAATLYGRAASVALQESLVALTRSLVGSGTTPAPYPYDPRNGVSAEAPAFGDGSGNGTVTGQPAGLARRLARVDLSWQGGARGLDRPLDQAFVTLQRRVRIRMKRHHHGGKRRAARHRRRWRNADSDLGLHVLWTVDNEGRYRAVWEPPLDAPAGIYRFRVEANLYGLTSNVFRLLPTDVLSARRVPAQAGKVAIELGYPPAIAHEDVGDPPGDFTADLNYRPPTASGGSVRFRVNGKPVRVRRRQGTAFSVPAPAGAQIEIPAGAARDRFGNRNGDGLSFQA
jgi:neutral ceramidase